MNTARRRRNGPVSAGAPNYGTAPGKQKTPVEARKRGKARRYHKPACIYFARAVIVLAVLIICITFYALGNGIVQAGSVEPQPVPPLVVEDPAWHMEALEPQVMTCIEPPYTQEELETLALVIYQEAGGDDCSDETRRMVGTVVLNRVADDRYPDTIQEVATQYRQYGRLYWTGIQWPERANQEVEAHAVQRAYDIAEELLLGDRALPADVIFQSEYIQGEIVAEGDGFYFCR